jgi:hypothetical protein
MPRPAQAGWGVPVYCRLCSFFGSLVWFWFCGYWGRCWYVLVLTLHCIGIVPCFVAQKRMPMRMGLGLRLAKRNEACGLFVACGLQLGAGRGAVNSETCDRDWGVRHRMKNFVGTVSYRSYPITSRDTRHESETVKAREKGRQVRSIMWQWIAQSEERIPRQREQ